MKTIASFLRKLADKIDPPKTALDTGGGGGPRERA